MFCQMQRRMIYSLPLIVLMWAEFDRVAEAQILPAGDELATGVEQTEDGFIIQGGQISDDRANLFHSFEQFDLQAGEIANFVTTSEVHSILGRITGGEASSIDGLIQVTGSSADLFLLNPAGIVFGENARLDVAGDFTATTARAIGFESGWFESVGSVSWGDLTGEPIAFDFSSLSGEHAGAIVNFGDLSVNRGSNLNLFGGTVINGGTLTGGNVSVTAVSGGNTLQLSAAGNVLGLEVASDRIAGAGISPIALPELLTGGNLASAGSLSVVDGVVRLSGAEIVAGDSVVTGAIDVSSEDIGGVVQVLGDRVLLAGAAIDASGEQGGGAVYLGGEYRGGGTLPTAAITLVDADSTVKANATRIGDGGEVIVWADGTAGFFGEITARGGALGGDGGLVETSGAGSLVFRGGVDLAAPQGLVGSLLLDPTNITISSSALSNPAELETINPFAIAAADYSSQDVTIDSAFLQEITGNVTLEATNNITLTTNLTFVPGGAIVFTADSDHDGTGEFDGMNDLNGGVFQRFAINASGRDLTISGTNIAIGVINTSRTGDNAVSGDVTLRSYESYGGVVVDTINTSTTGNNATSGAVRIESDGGIDLNVVSGGAGVNTSSSGLESRSGDITLISRSTTNSLPFRAFDLDSSSIGNDANSGSIQIETHGGNLAVGAVYATSSGDNAQSGDISIDSGGGKISTLATGVRAGASGDAGQGGNISLDSGGGMIIAQVLDSNSSGEAATAGNIEVLSGGGEIDTEYIGAATGGDGVTRSGNILLDGRGSTGTGLVDAYYLTTNSASSQGTAGNVTVYGSGNLDIENIFAVSANTAGDVTIGANGTINLGRIDAYGILGESGEVTIGGLPDGSTADSITISSLESLSYNGETRGGVTITADGNIKLSGLLQTGASSGSSASPVVIRSENGSITYDTVRTTVANARPINANFSPSTGNLAAEYTTLSDDTSLSIYLRSDLDTLVLWLEQITPTDFATIATPAPAGDLTLTAPNGTIAATGNLDTYSQSGAAGQVQITSGSGLTLQDVTSYGHTASGNLTITSTGAIATTDITTLASSGKSGSVIINGTSVVSRDVRSIAGTGSGNINITATDGSITTRNLSTTTTSGSSGSVAVSGTGNVTTGNITSSTDGDGDSGDITAESSGGSVTTGDVTTESAGGNSGNIDFSALIDIITGNLTSSAGQNSGDITLDAGRDINTGDITSAAVDGDSGDISLTAGGDITAGDITSSSENGESGDISLDAGGNINTGDITTEDGQISLNADGTIATGDLSSDNAAIVNGELLESTTNTNNVDAIATATAIETQQRESAIATIQTDSSLNPNTLSTTATTSSVSNLTGDTSDAAIASETQADTSALAGLSSGFLSVQTTNISLGDIIKFDDSRTNEYTQHFGGDGNLTGSVAATREAMANIEAQTGIRTGVVYISLRDTAIDLSVITAADAPITVTVPVDRATLLDTVATYRNYLINARYRLMGRHNDYAAQLYDWLIRPIATDLDARGIDTLMLSLDVGLRGLPIAALYDGEHYLIERHSLSLIPSMGLIDTRYQPLSENAPMLAMGASEFTALAPLPAVPAELDTLVNHRRNGEIVLNADFTRRNIIAERDRTPYPIIHLATHGEFNEGALSNSYIQLWDERIGLDQIRELGWNEPPLELLVLSACQTALGNTEAEMGFAGLAVAAGVKTAIASLWYVDDAATFMLMSELYHYLATAPIKAEALRSAQLALMRGNVRIIDGMLYADGIEEPIPVPESLSSVAGHDFSNPYYWSGFTAIGAPW